jgi:hypothetical protein
MIPPSTGRTRGDAIPFGVAAKLDPATAADAAAVAEDVGEIARRLAESPHRGTGPILPAALPDRTAP